MAAVTSVLQGLHTNKAMLDLGLEIMMQGKQLRVVATREYETGKLELAPCFPKSLKVLKESKHPAKIPITVQRLWNDNCTTHRVYYVIPEWRGPQETTPDDEEAAVAATSEAAVAAASDGSEVDAEATITTTWSFTGEETMHPFWAVPRLTPCEIARFMALAPNAAFNMELTEGHPFQTMTVGTFLGRRINSLCSVRVPMLTNSRKLWSGDDLITKADQKKAPEQRDGDWTSQVSQRSKAPRLTPPGAAPSTGKHVQI